MEDASSETVILTDISTDILCCMNAIATPSHCPDELLAAALELLLPTSVSLLPPQRRKPE